MNFVVVTGSLGIKNENKICRTCLNTCDGSEIIGETIKEALNEIHLKIDLSITSDPVICEKCSEAIQKWSTFKRSTDIRACPSRDRINYKSGYNRNVCRLCMEIQGYFVSLSTEEKYIASIKILLLKYFNEIIDINHIKDPIICSPCFKNLEACSTFINAYLDTEEKIKKYREDNGIDNTTHVDLSVLKNETKTEEICTPTSPLKYDDDSLIMDTILELEDGKVDAKYENTQFSLQQDQINIKSDDTPEQRHDFPPINILPTETSYVCDICDFNTTKPVYLKKHTLSHKSMSEVTTWSCAMCSFTTKYKRSLRKHILTHKKSKINSESSPKARVARYTSNSKGMLRCTECSYETNKKRYLFRHTLVHKSVTEAVMHACAECSFKTKHKESLIRHVALHRSEIESAVLICPLCEYRTKVKRYLRRHVKIHE